MRRKKNKQLSKWQICLYSKITTAVGLVLVVALSVVLYNNYKRGQVVYDEIQGYDETIVTLERENQKMNEMIGYLKSAEYVDAQAKHKLGLKREGEVALVIPDTQVDKLRNTYILGEQQDTTQVTDSAAEVQETEQIIVTDVPNYKLWWEYFFDNI